MWGWRGGSLLQVQPPGLVSHPNVLSWASAPPKGPEERKGGGGKGAAMFWDWPWCVSKASLQLSFLLTHPPDPRLQAQMISCISRVAKCCGNLDSQMWFQGPRDSSGGKIPSSPSLTTGSPRPHTHMEEGENWLQPASCFLTNTRTHKINKINAFLQIPKRIKLILNY